MYFVIAFTGLIFAKCRNVIPRYIPANWIILRFKFDIEMIDACSFNKTNNTDCPRITEDEKMFLDHFRFWIGGVVTCCVAITGKKPDFHFFSNINVTFEGHAQIEFYG